MTDAASVRDFDVGRQSVDNSLLQQKRESFMPDISQEYYTQYVILIIQFLGCLCCSLQWYRHTGLITVWMTVPWQTNLESRQLWQ